MSAEKNFDSCHTYDSVEEKNNISNMREKARCTVTLMERVNIDTNTYNAECQLCCVAAWPKNSR